ncbi:MAG: sodium:solute symporter family protein [Xanthomonadales bacterium]|nr:sodium:solute symporter family protein [Xanthomonadales bacterium]
MPDSMLTLGSVTAYVLVILAVGIYAGRRVHDQTDYIVAGRNLSLGMLVFTLFATFYGGGTIMGVSGAAYSDGMMGVIPDPFGAALCLFLAGLLFFRVLYRMKLLTVVDFFRIRYGPRCETLAGICMIPPYVGWVSSQFVAFGFILHLLTGIDTTTGMVVSAGIVIVYTVIGGLWAVALTDFIQALILILGMLVLTVLVVGEAGGLGAVLAAVPEAHRQLIPQGGLRDWAWYIQAWVVIGLGGIPAQDMIQRAVSARSENSAVHSAYLAGLMYLGFGMMPVLLGLAALGALPAIDNPEYIIPTLAMDNLPPLLLAVVLGAILSGIMSSADSALLAPASVVGENLARLYRKELTASQVLLISRVAVVVLGLVGLGLALYFQRIYDIMVGSWSVLLVSLLVPLFAGIYWRRANTSAAVASIVIGLVSWVVLSMVQDQWPADLLAALIAAVTIVVVALATSSRDKPLPLTTLDGNPLTPETAP